MAMNLSFSATRKERARKERARYEKKCSLGVNGGQGPKARPTKKRADYPEAVNKVLVIRRQMENPNPKIPEHLRFRQRPIEERERLEQQWRRWGWISWSQSSSSSSATWWPASTEKPTWWSSEDWQEFRVVKRTTVFFFQGVSLTGNSDTLVTD